MAKLTRSNKEDLARKAIATAIGDIDYVGIFEQNEDLNLSDEDGEEIHNLAARPAMVRAMFPPEPHDDPSKIRVKIVSYGETTAVYDRAEYEKAVAADRLDHLIDTDAADLDETTVVIQPDGTRINPYC